MFGCFVFVFLYQGTFTIVLCTGTVLTVADIFLRALVRWFTGYVRYHPHMYVCNMYVMYVKFVKAFLPPLYASLCFSLHLCASLCFSVLLCASLCFSVLSSLASLTAHRSRRYRGTQDQRYNKTEQTNCFCKDKHQN